MLCHNIQCGTTFNPIEYAIYESNCNEQYFSDKEIRLPIFFPTIQNNAQTVELKNALLEGIAKAGQVDSNRIQDMDVRTYYDSITLSLTATLP